MTVGALLAAHSPTTVEVLGTAAIAVTALAGAATTAMVARAGLGNRRFVRSLTLALAIAGVGAGLGVLAAVRWNHGPLALDLASVAATLVLLSALVHHPDLGPPRQRARVLADALIAGLSMAILLWLVAGRALFHTEAHRLESLALVASASIGFVITRVGLVVTLPREGRMRSASALLTVAFGICAGGGALRLLGEAHPSAPFVLAAGYGAVVVGILLVSLAGLMLTRPIPGPRPRLDDRRTRALLEITPVLTASVAGIAVLIDAAARGRFDATALAVLTVVLTAVLLRQSLMLADNRGRVGPTGNPRRAHRSAEPTGSRRADRRRRSAGRRSGHGVRRVLRGRRPPQGGERLAGPRSGRPADPHDRCAPDRVRRRPGHAVRR
jgi:hypothetical protein